MSAFLWRGRTLVTMGDVLSALNACKTPREAQDFLAAYERVSEHARENLGYGSGYLDNARGQELREWIDTPHPVFGVESPGPGEAFAYGLKQGAES